MTRSRRCAAVLALVVCAGGLVAPARAEATLDQCESMLLEETRDPGFFSCVDVDSQQRVGVPAVTPTPSGRCPPSGGVLEGEVTTSGTVTLCCLSE